MMLMNLRSYAMKAKVMIMNKKLVIIGAGSGGLCAAISAYKHGTHDILLIEQDQETGGILNQCIHNGFGLHTFQEELTGPAFAQRLKDEIAQLPIDIWLDTCVTNITKEKMVICQNKNGIHHIQAQAIIITAGCYERSQGAIALTGHRPKGIYTAGQAQKYLNQDGYLVGKNVFILGSGDIGLIMARRMSLEGAKVYGVAEIMPYSNGLKRNIVQCLDDFDIPLYLSHTISNIFGKDKLEAIEISPVDENRQIIPNQAKRFNVDTLLLSVGLIPENSLIYQLGLPLDPKTKGPIVDEFLQLLPGIFAAGNGLHVHDLVDHVASEARQAGINASLYLENKLSNKPMIQIIAGENVSYCVPQFFHQDSSGFKLSLRVKLPMPKAKLQFFDDNKLLKEQVMMNLFPAEMVTYQISADVLASISTKLTIKAVMINE